ncbi:long-chain fatty acid--CoA ligase [Ramlibacter rhizophilus]|uniref:Long-chain fatty acid--CoA ligase n=1 Tax=Ramlibacter rhizophilus TaxID=1781167 RepID=A0A4Z0BHH2_9BURK|nr:long-chain fatty acid--CoA ligase [Ramlibacter rhizophilus]TFY97564.1 long-chain fatty acid--CoA ligase [Ramlibacter rhizophilus]
MPSPVPSPSPETRHLPHWPPGQSQHLTLPETHLFHAAEVSAARFPHKPFIVFYDQVLSFSQFKAQAEAIAGWLQHDGGVRPGDRVLLDMQNSPQWVLAYYGILRADAVVVPVNPMNKREELRHYMQDAGARVAFVAQDLLGEMQPLLGEGLDHLVVATYSDYLGPTSELPVPPLVSAPREPLPAAAGLVAWAHVLAAARTPQPMRAGPGDLAVMPYTSGTTGKPKGCMHTHRSVLSTAVGGVQWFGRTQDWVMLATLPFFHVTGMSGSMNGPLYAGGTLVLLPRWDREAAARCIERHRVTTWQAISTMVIDFVANPAIGQHDLSSLVCIRGGGAAMPQAVAEKLKALTGLDFVEGYGMSETMAATHINPTHRPKPQCLGIPVYDVDARLVDPETLAGVAPGEVGEIVVNAPQVMQGYWRNEAATREAFIDIEGRPFLRTGDLARVDEDGYFFMADRLKRMINASGFKVWPAEVEALMYHHPAIQEACVIAARDARRGETVKALVVLKPGLADAPDAAAVSAWCHERMAAYKVPRVVEFVPALPRSGSGKVMWRELQEQQDARDAAAAKEPPR